jgi:catechol 2,3-dioxygenase-like lactoylglutathione lyase family enzyme
LRTTDMASSIRFYTEKLGFSVEFNYQDFYTGIRAGGQIFHLKLVDEKDPSIRDRIPHQDNLASPLSSGQPPANGAVIRIPGCHGTGVHVLIDRRELCAALY